MILAIIPNFLCDTCSLPTTKQVFICFLQQNWEKSRSVANLKQIYCSVAAFQVNNCKFPVTFRQLKNFITGAKRIGGKPTNRKEPMTIEILKQIIFYCLKGDLYKSSGFSQPLNLWRETAFEYFAFLTMSRFDDLFQ